MLQSSPSPIIRPAELKCDARFMRLCEVTHLRDDIVQHHMREWPQSSILTNAAKWGYLTDTKIQSTDVEVPFTIVATVNGAYAGKGSLVPKDLKHPDYEKKGPWLAGLCVRDEVRRFGIGSHLVKEVIRHAAIIGVEQVYLFTEMREYKPLEMYAKLGWKLEGMRPDYNDGSTIETRWVMSANPRKFFDASGRELGLH